MDDYDKIDILLSTYCGEKYLMELLSSLKCQTVENWKLIVRDDGSTDGTVGLLRHFRSELPDRVHFLGNDNRNIGPVKSYEKLLQASRSPYVMLCDQDDIWDADKISRTMDLMKNTEEKSDPGTPILVHSDLRVIGPEGGLVAESFWKYQGLAPETARFLNRLLTQNVVTGCTMMINRPLCLMTSNIPDGAVMHDWWIALVACVFGKINYLSEPTVRYRQHRQNYLGAVEYDPFGRSLMGILARDLRELFIKGSLAKTVEQASELLKLYRSQMTPATAHVLDAFVSLGSSGFWKKRIVILRNGFFKCGAMRNIGLLLRA